MLATDDNNSQIPAMQVPGTVIEYAEDGSWYIVSRLDKHQSNNYVQPRGISETNPNKEKELWKEEQLVDAIEEEAKNFPEYIATYPAPSIGMRVKYDNWGEIESVSLPDEKGQYQIIEPIFVATTTKKSFVPKKANLLAALAQGTRKPAGTYTYGSVVSNAVGYTTNTIKITTGSVLGTGDFTCFTDAIGDHDNYLQYGDCATKNSIDNPWYGTVIYARNMTNNVGTSFIKNDNGGLPNAVLDIWKTGLTKLGVTSTSYDYIKFAGRYYYTF